MTEAQDLADRYVAAWAEPDVARRRAAIEALWVPAGEHYVNDREVRGYDELMERVRGSHEKNIRDDGNRFRAAKDARRLHDVVTFHWEMLRTEGGEVVATGFEFLIVDPQGRIRIDYQFFL